MKFDIVNLKGSKVSDLNADSNVFGIEPNIGAVRQAILSEMTNMRQGTHSTKNRSDVKGGGKKPWKQKGRGVARAGTIRSPLWKGGGTVFGPEPHDYNHKLPKRLSKLARCSILSTKASEGNILVVEDFTIDSHKTSEFVSDIESFNLKNLLSDFPSLLSLTNSTFPVLLFLPPAVIIALTRLVFCLKITLPGLVTFPEIKTSISLGFKFVLFTSIS